MSGYVINFTVYTLAMTGLICFAVFVYKKITDGSFRSNNSKYLSVEETMSLSPRKTLHVVRAGNEKALLNKEIPEAEADLLAHLSDGSLGQALRFREDRITDFRNAALKYVAEFPLRAPMTYLLNEDYFSDIIPSAGGNEQLQQFVAMTVSLLRDLLFVKSGLPDQVFNVDALPHLQKIAKKWDASRLHQATEAAQEAAAAAVRRANTKSVLDNMTFKINACCEGKG